MLEIAPLRLGTDWFSECELSPTDISAILGPDSVNQEEAIDKFNLLGTYLVENVQIFPGEIREWLYSGMRRLGGKRPIDILHDEDGFDKVFEEAVSWRDDFEGL